MLAKPGRVFGISKKAVIDKTPKTHAQPQLYFNPNVKEVGDDVEISSEIGGLKDGHILFKIGGELTACINSDRQLCMDTNIINTDIVVDEKNGPSITPVDIRCNFSIINIQVIDIQSDIITGRIYTDAHWLTISASVIGDGIPYVWISGKGDGYYEYSVCALRNTVLTGQISLYTQLLFRKK